MPGAGPTKSVNRAWDAANGAAFALQSHGGVPLLSRSADTAMPERVRARRANRLGAEMIVSFQLPVEEPGIFFFASSMSRSEAGALLAAEMASNLDLMVDGRAVPILKETRAPAVVIATAALDASVGESAVAAMASFLLQGGAYRRCRRRSAEQPSVETLQFGDRPVVDHHPALVVAVLDLNLCPELLRQSLLQFEQDRGASFPDRRVQARSPSLSGPCTASSIRRTDHPSSTARRATCSANRSSSSPTNARA